MTTVQVEVFRPPRDYGLPSVLALLGTKRVVCGAKVQIQFPDGTHMPGFLACTLDAGHPPRHLAQQTDGLVVAAWDDA